MGASRASSRLSTPFTLWQKQRGGGAWLAGRNRIAGLWVERASALEQISTVGSAAECQGSRALFLFKHVTS